MPPHDEESFRMKVLACARGFKRSWIDMAALLVTVRNRGLYRQWGFESLEGYALEELHIKRPTCEKLTGSYSAIEEHAPQVLNWDGVAQPLPDLDAVDYFSRAVAPRPKRQGEPAPPAPAGDIVEQLRQATFEELANPAALKRRFTPLLQAKDDQDERSDLLRKLKASAARVEALLADIDGLAPERVDQVARCLQALRSDLDRLEQTGPDAQLTRT